jgi:hypothetical protein
MGRLWIVPLGIVASLISIVLVTQQWRSVLDVFELADPTGSFGNYFFLGGLAANLAVVFITICVLLPRVRSNVRLRFAAVAFVPSLLVPIEVAPCFLSTRPGALCGFFFVLAGYVSVPVILVAAIGFVATAEYRSVKVAGVILAASIIAFAAAAQLLLAPSDPDQCAKFAEVTKRSNCLRVFANRRHDEQICRGIEFRTTRFTCLREIAVEKHQPVLCGEIIDTGPIAAYEAPAVFYRDTCFQNLAYAMHDHSQCAKVEDKPLRASCEGRNP